MSIFKKPELKLLSLAAGVLGCILNYSVPAQGNGYASSQEVSESDGVPVIMKHLPDWENVRGSAVFIQDKNALKSALGELPVLDLIDFAGGTEAAYAAYPTGKLLIVEYATPQASVYADGQFSKHLAQNPPSPSVVYRRIGNYSAFVFDANDATVANALLDQIAYEKNVQWLGEDPFLLQKIERYFALTGRDVAISTVLWIALIFGVTLAVGGVSGYFYYRYRESQRASMTAFTDAGGMTRLNLDDLSEPIN